MSLGIVQCKPDNFLDLGPIEENPCNSKTSFSAITGGCINKFGVIGNTKLVFEAALIWKSGKENILLSFYMFKLSE